VTDDAAPLGYADTLTALRLAQARTAAGPWRRGDLIGPIAFSARHSIDVLVGIYLIADEHGRLVYLGQARRDGGILARLDGHAADPLKRDAFRDVWVLPLHDCTDPQTVAAIEGRIADDLALRGRLKAERRNRVWPSATRWTELVASTHAATRAASSAD
jgi:hypothetical protein